MSELPLHGIEPLGNLRRILANDIFNWHRKAHRTLGRFATDRFAAAARNSVRHVCRVVIRDRNSGLVSLRGTAFSTLRQREPSRKHTERTVLTLNHRRAKIAGMPAATEPEIEEVCARIREISRGELTPKAETELRKLALVLRLAIARHVKLAKSSLTTKKSAIEARDPEQS